MPLIPGRKDANIFPVFIDILTKTCNVGAGRDALKFRIRILIREACEVDSWKILLRLIAKTCEFGVGLDS